ncbi:hypothetical protein L6R50_20505 [Myxococcota bacterium]|nr:hypothetical protein [Myxococcota bacterium]
MTPATRLAAAAALSALAVASACDSSISDTSIGALEPDIVVDPQVLEYGWVEEGQEKVETLVVTNAGQGSLRLEGLSFEADAAEFYALEGISTEDLPLVISAEDSVLEIPISFAPDRGQYGPATLLVESDDPDTPAIEVTLKGNTGIPYASIVAESAGTVAHSWYIAGDHGKTGMDADLGDARDLDWDGGASGKFNLDPHLDLALSFPPAAPGAPRTYTLYTRTNAGSYLSEEWDPGEDVRLRFSADLDGDGLLDLVGSDPDPAYEGGANPGTRIWWMKGTSAQTDTYVRFAPAEHFGDIADLASPGARVIWPTSARDTDPPSASDGARSPDLLFGVIRSGAGETELWWLRNDGAGGLVEPVQVGVLPGVATFVEGVDFLPGAEIDLMWSTAGDPGEVLVAPGNGDGTFDLSAAATVADLDEEAEGPESGWPDLLGTGATRFGDENSLETLAVAIPLATGSYGLITLVTDNAGGGEIWPIGDSLPGGRIVVPDDHPRP